jgi:hypothetical protein
LKPRKAEQTVESYVNEIIQTHSVVVFSKTTCPFSAKVKEFFKNLPHEFLPIELDQIGKRNKENFNLLTKSIYKLRHDWVKC